MILQNIILPDVVCKEPKIYYQADGMLEFEDSVIKIPERKNISFFSYMNMFDLNAWKNYTTLEKIIFRINAKGNGNISLKVRDLDCDEVLTSFRLNNKDWEGFSYEMYLEQVHGCCYFEIQTESEVWIKDACFTSSNLELISNKVKLALNICTYHRNAEIKRNLELLRNSCFFQPQDEFFKKMQVVVVDNGSELKELNEENIQIVHNQNTGGSGGFKRGLEEIRSWKKDTTHVIFMDDDVEFQLESLYRLYALLSYMKIEYIHESIAGRMFRTDNRQIQYTAAEKWNKGELIHIGLNTDMTLHENILQINDNSNAEYGGWWFCCYPMEFVKDNDPLPFFIHCDDVEYGLRHGGIPIILNGIQVWHETYEYRQSAVVTYYDIRNTLIVNDICHLEESREFILNNWISNISYFHVNKMYLHEYMAILAMNDYLKGVKWIYKIDSQRYHKKISSKKDSNKFFNAIFWRYTKMKMLRKEIN